MQVLKTWLFDIVKDLRSVDVHSPTDNGRRMRSVLVVLAVLFKASWLLIGSDTIRADEISLPFSMLRLYQEPRAADLTILMNSVSEKCYDEVARVFAFFTKKMLPSSFDMLQWVFVIPLIHFFRKKTKPFQDPALISKEIVWFDADIPLARLNSNKTSRYLIINFTFMH